MKREKAEILAALSMGSPGRAASPELQGFAERKKIWIQEISALRQGDFAGALDLAGRLSGSREDSLMFLEWLGGWFRDVLLYRVTDSPDGICNPDAVGPLKGFAEHYSLERALLLGSQAVKATERIRQNVNRRMALENILSQLVRTG